MRLILLLSLFITEQAYAFTLNTSVAAAFKRNEIYVNVADHSCDVINYSPEEILSMVGEAVNQFWNRVPTSRLKLLRGSLVSVSSDFKTERACSNTGSGNCTINSATKVSSDILISCNNSSDNFSGTGILGLTVPNNVSSKEINGSLFLINDRPGSQVNDLTRSQMVAFLAHEIGHAVGLGHSPVTDSLMYYRTIPTRTALGRDDRQGITYLYPKRQPDLGINCGTVENQGGPPFLIGLLVTLLLGHFATGKRHKIS